MTEGQSQSGGIGSTNLQVGSLNVVGLSYADVRDIAKDVIAQSMAQLAESARATAEQRVSELVELLITKLEQTPDAHLRTFVHPEKQIALRDAERAFAQKGDVDLKEALTDLIVALAKCDEERSVKGIVISEAIKVVPLLTKSQLNAISIVFIVRYTQTYPDTLERLFSLLEDSLDAQVTRPTGGDLRHIEYTRCGSASIGEVSFISLLRHAYAPLCNQTVYSRQELELGYQDAGDVPWYLFPPVEGHEEMFRPTVVYENLVRDLASKGGLTVDQLDATLRILKSKPISDAELSSKIEAVGDFARQLKDAWDQTGLKSVTLTSVGVTVGFTHTVMRKRRDAQLETWLS